jgi:acetyl esterase/lipase
MRDWNDEFANSAHIPGSEKLPAIWAARAADYRRKVMVEEDIPYGPLPRQKLDLIRPDGPSKGLVVFVHGGFWIRCARSDWTDLAQGACANGWTVALAGYTLAPEVRISEITQDIGTAIGKAAALVEGPIRLIGHSAGGHLACRMLCRNGPLAPDVLTRLEKTVSVSGLHDLRLLQRTAMNEALRLTDAEAEAESPALLRPMEAARLTCWVGAEERPEFRRQSRVMAAIWDGLAHTKLVEEPGHNHFSILDGLKDPKSPIVTELLTD